MMDDGGSWPALAIDGASALDVIKRLSGFETMLWQQIHGKDHHYNYKGICPEAKKRLFERKLEQWVDHLYSLKLRNVWRLWGLLIDGVFYVLWWDPDHSVYPVGPNL
jgi:hypothetical protein